MKYLLAFWATPLLLFWGWYFLSLNDINFGSIYLSRQLHDAVFGLYGQILGVDPATIPGLLADAFVFDTFLIGAIIAYRKRATIRQWWADRKEKQVETLPVSEAQPAAE